MHGTVAPHLLRGPGRLIPKQRGVTLLVVMLFLLLCTGIVSALYDELLHYKLSFYAIQRKHNIEQQQLATLRAVVQQIKADDFHPDAFNECHESMCVALKSYRRLQDKQCEAQLLHHFHIRIFLKNESHVALESDIIKRDHALMCALPEIEVWSVARS